MQRLYSSALRPKAKKWNQTSVIKSIQSTAQFNPMEQNQLLPINSKYVLQNNNTNTVDATHTAEKKGRAYAEVLINQLDRYAENQVGGGKSPLRGFEPTPKSVNEPNHGYMGHAGGRQKGFAPFRKDDMDGLHSSHPINIFRLQLQREESLEKRIATKSYESLQIALDNHDVQRCVELLHNNDHPIMKYSEPLVRRNLPLNDLTPQSSYKDLTKLVETGENHFDKDTVLTACERMLHMVRVSIWEIAHRRQDTVLGDEQLPFLENDLKPIIADASNKRNALLNILNKKIEVPENINKILTIIPQIVADLEKESLSKEDQLRVRSIQMLSKLFYQETNGNVIQSNADMLVDTIKKEEFTLPVYEALLTIDTDRTTMLKKKGHLNLIISRMHELGISPRLQTYNSLMEHCKTLHERATLLEDI